MRKKLLPLGVKNQMLTELPVLIAVEAIGTPWFCEGHRSDLKAIALIGEVLAARGSSIELAACELLRLLAAPELDREKTRPLALEVSAWFQRQPNHRVQRAIDRLLSQLDRSVA